MATIKGDRFPNKLVATQDGDTLIGGGGDDTLSSLFNDTGLFGGRDNDYLDVLVDRTQAADVDLTAYMDGGSGDDELSSYLRSESETGNASATSVLIGGNGDDILGDPNGTSATALAIGVEASASQTIDGGAGSDVGVANTSAYGETFAIASAFGIGGSGDDTIFLPTLAQVSSSGDWLVSTSLDGGSGDDNLISFTSGSGGYGGNTGSIDSEITGGSGDDTIRAAVDGVDGPDDIGITHNILGGAGNDQITFEAMSVFHTGTRSSTEVCSTFDGGNNNDTIDASVQLVNLASQGEATIATDMYGGRGVDNLSAHAEILGFTSQAGSTARQSIHGGNNDDVLYATTDVGGAFAIAETELFGDNGNDLMTAMTIATSVNQPATASNLMYGGNGHDIMDGTASASGTDPSAINHMDGGAGDDVLVGRISDGSTGFSHLSGGAGEDDLKVFGGECNILDGGAGDDALCGGDNRDGFLYIRPNTGDLGFDTITMFQQGGVGADDKVGLVGYSIGDLTISTATDTALLSDGTQIYFSGLGGDLSIDDFNFLSSADEWIW
jgi:Ca2+-binding RTX toxin-like protein